MCSMHLLSHLSLGDGFRGYIYKDLVMYCLIRYLHNSPRSQELRASLPSLLFHQFSPRVSSSGHQVIAYPESQNLLFITPLLYLWFLLLYARLPGSNAPFAEYPFFLDFISESTSSSVYLDVSIWSFPTDSFRVDFKDRPFMKLPRALAQKLSLPVFIFFCCCRWNLMTAYSMCMR